MGNFFSPQSDSQQATTNSQVAAQGGAEGSSTVAVGSGTTGSVASGAGSSAIRDITSGGGTGSSQTINIVTSDVEADNNLATVAGEALASNQAVSTDSVNAANQVSINALETVQGIAGELGATTQEALQTTGQVATEAAPQSAGYTANQLAATTGAFTSQEVEYFVAGLAIIAVAIYLYHGRA